MKESIRTRLRQVAGRYEEIARLLSQPDVMADQNTFRDLSREYSQLEPVVNAWRRWLESDNAMAEAEQMLGDPDPGVRELAGEEFEAAEAQQRELEQELRLLLLPRDPLDDKNTIIEVRSGTGGEEASLFVGDLVRMYSRYAERKGWKWEFLNTSPTELGGYREATRCHRTPSQVSATPYASRASSTTNDTRDQPLPTVAATAPSGVTAACALPA